MEGSNVKNLSKFRYEKAISNLEIAKTMFESQDYGVALNRAYYAAFDAMKSVNALDGFDSSKHSGVIAHFNQEYVKTGKFPTDTSSIIKKASMLREKSDYEDFYQPDKEETKETIENVEEFLMRIKKYLQEKEII